MKKKLLSLVLVLVLAMALTLLPTAAFAAGSTPHNPDSHTNITWTSNGDGTHSGVCQADDCNQGGVAQNEACTAAADAQWTTNSENKRVRECQYCHAKFGAHDCDTNGTDSSCSVCGYKASQPPAGDVELTVTAAASAAQDGTTPKIKTSITIDPGKDMEASALKNAVAVAASVGSDAKAQNLVVVLPNASTKSGTAHTFEVYFTMPGEAANVTAETTVTLKVSLASGATGYTLKNAQNGVLTLTTKLSTYAKPETGGKSISNVQASYDKTAKKLSVQWESSNLVSEDKLKIVLASATGSVPTLENDTNISYDVNSKEFTNITLTAGATYTVTVFLSLEVKSDKTFTVQADSKPSTPSTPVTPEKPAEKPKDEDKTPSTDSQGIPVASQVKSEKQADAAVKILKNTNAEVLQERLMTSDSALSSFRSLERAVMSAKSVSVWVETDRNAVPSAVRSGVGVDGAAFNADSSTVRLLVDAPSRAYHYSTGYQISMTLTGVRDASRLDVPVVLTLPLPSDVSAGQLVVLHYHDGDSSPSVIVPAVIGDKIRFPVTGFSDFAVISAYDYERPSGGGYLRGNYRRDNADNMDIVLPAILAMLSHDGVFVDVPATHWAVKEIRWARNGGLMSGYDNGEFRPWAATTRQELWMVLGRLAGARPADMAMAREWAMNTGVSDGSNPHGPLSRQQLVTMLYRFAGSQGKNMTASAKLGGYADNRLVAPYARDAFSWAVAKGIVGGDANGNLNPETTATRAHFAVLLYRYNNG